MEHVGTVRRLKPFELDRFAATDAAGVTYMVVRICHPFRVLEVAGWSDVQHTDISLSADGIEVTISPDGSLELQTNPPTPLRR